MSAIAPSESPRSRAPSPSIDAPAATCESGPRHVAIIGGGPAGLAAAEILATEHGAPEDRQIDVYDAMPSVGRKFLRAGIGGLNITHSEPYDAFCGRFGPRAPALQQALDAFTPDALRAWVDTLGVSTFVGTSGRVFPAEMKAAPLLRAWIHRLRERGVRLHTRHRWHGWNAPAGTAESDTSDRLNATADASVPDAADRPRADGRFVLRFDTPDGVVERPADAVVLALGGGSWPQLGSDGAWLPWLRNKGIAVAPLRSANGGFTADWSAHLRERFAGAPLKSVALSFTDLAGETLRRQGEFVLSERGVEGSLIYAFSRVLRETVEARGSARFTLDLVPGRDAAAVVEAVTHPRGSRSLSSHLQSRLGLTGVKTALLYEILDKPTLQDAPALAAAIKALPITVHATLPLAEAISSAGGVRFDALDTDMMVRCMPGVFVAGEMLDWEAPTGGYLLTGCLATGRHVGRGVARYLEGTAQGPARST